MVSKRNIKNPKKRTRLVKIITQSEVNRWNKLFALHGTKTHFQETTGIPRITLRNALNDKKGDVRVIKAIREYFESQSIMA